MAAQYETTMLELYSALNLIQQLRIGIILKPAKPSTTQEKSGSVKWMQQIFCNFKSVYKFLDEPVLLCENFQFTYPNILCYAHALAKLQNTQDKKLQEFWVSEIKSQNIQDLAWLFSVKNIHVVTQNDANTMQLLLFTKTPVADCDSIVERIRGNPGILR